MEDQHPEIFRIKSKYASEGLSTGPTDYPSFGDGELNIWNNDHGSTMTGFFRESYFAPPIIGNTLAGGKEFQKKFGWYSFNIQYLNVFRIQQKQ